MGTTVEKASEISPTGVDEIPDGPIIGNGTCLQENGPSLVDFGPFETANTVWEDESGVNDDFGVGVDLNDVGGVNLNDVGGADINEKGGVDLNDAGGVDINVEPTVCKDGACGVEVDAEPTCVEENIEERGDSDDSALNIRFGDSDDDFWLAGNFDNEIGGRDDEEGRGEAFNDDPMKKYFEGVDSEDNVIVGDDINGADGVASGNADGFTSDNAEPTASAGVVDCNAGVDCGKYISSLLIIHVSDSSH